MHLFPAGSIKLVRTVLKHYQLGTFLEQVRRASQSVNLAQWGDNTSAESNSSRTFYSGPAYFVESIPDSFCKHVQGTVVLTES